MYIEINIPNILLGIYLLVALGLFFVVFFDRHSGHFIVQPPWYKEYPYILIWPSAPFFIIYYRIQDRRRRNAFIKKYPAD